MKAALCGALAALVLASSGARAQPAAEAAARPVSAAEAAGRAEPAAVAAGRPVPAAVAAGRAEPGAEAAAARPVPPPVREVAVTERVGAELPLELAFTAADGRRVRLGDAFDGETPVVLALAYTRCAMLCSLVLRGLADAVRQSPAELGADYRVVTVSIDPAETPADAARQKSELLEVAGRRGAGDAWSFLVGDEPAIRSLADSVGFSYAWDERTEQFAHPAVIFVVSGAGEVETYLHGIQYAGDLDDALAGRATEARDEGGLLSCFRFDPALRRYAGLIDGLFQGGAVLLLCTVGGLVGWLLLRERRRR